MLKMSGESFLKKFWSQHLVTRAEGPALGGASWVSGKCYSVNNTRSASSELERALRPCGSLRGRAIKKASLTGLSFTSKNMDNLLDTHNILT